MPPPDGGIRITWSVVEPSAVDVENFRHSLDHPAARLAGSRSDSVSRSAEHLFEPLAEPPLGVGQIPLGEGDASHGRSFTYHTYDVKPLEVYV